MNTRKWLRGFQIARAASKHSNGPVISKRLGAALFSGSSLVAIGFNVYNQTHPDSRHKKFDNNLHAEHKAIIKRQYYTNKSMTMYVWRETIEGTPACSKPCNNCQFLMREASVKNVRFINEEGKFSEIRL